MKNLSVACRCGSVAGKIETTTKDPGNRAVCYCDDCQAFAKFLGVSTDILDPNGGSDIFQISPAQLQIHSGHKQLACVSLKPKGLLRWYCACCNWPVGNTLATQQVPFVGVLTQFLETADSDTGLTETLGPVRNRVHGRFASTDPATLGAHPKAPLSMLFQVAGKLLARRLRGDHRRNPLFDSKGDPVCAPKVLSEAERNALY